MAVMRHTSLTNKSPVVLSLALVVSILVTSIVYACSGLTSMQMNMNDASMNHQASAKGPCADQKQQDICKFVRDSMVSLKTAPYKAETQQAILQVPIDLVVAIPQHIASLSAYRAWEIAFQSVFKIPRPVSFSVLRI